MNFNRRQRERRKDLSGAYNDDWTRTDQSIAEEIYPILFVGAFIGFAIIGFVVVVKSLVNWALPVWT